MNVRGGRAAARGADGCWTRNGPLRLAWLARTSTASGGTFGALSRRGRPKGVRAHDRRAQSFFEATRYIPDSSIGEITTRPF